MIKQGFFCDGVLIGKVRNRKLTAALQEVSEVMGEAVLLAPSNLGDSRAIRFRRNTMFYGCHCTVRSMVFWCVLTLG